MVKDPLVGPLCAVALGIGIGHFVWFDGRQALLATAVLAGLAVLARLLRGADDRFMSSASSSARAGQTTKPDHLPHGEAKVSVVAALSALVFAGIATEALHRLGQPPRIAAAADETLVLSGCVVEPSIFYQQRDQFTLELASHANARVYLALRDGETPPELGYGQRVELEARVRRVTSYRNPGSFDYAAWSAQRDLYWNAFMRPGSRPRVLSGRCGSRFFAIIYGLRSAALRQVERLYPGDDYAIGMMDGVLIGDNTKVEKDWTDDFRRTGTYHTLVISGLHVMVLAGVFLFLLRVCLMPELPALAVTCASTWMYALISGFGSPAVRAAGGLTLYLCARFFYRRGRVLNLLAAVALVYLFFEPSKLFEASFQLSFLSVAAIGALATPLIASTSKQYAFALRDLNDISRDPHLDPRAAQFRVELRLVAETLSYYSHIPPARLLPLIGTILRLGCYAWEMAVISTVVQIGLALPMAVYFHRISFSGFSANILIIPLLCWVVPVGFFAIFTGWHLPAAAARLLLLAAQGIARWHARIEPNWRVADPPLWLSIAFVASLLVFAATLRRSRCWRWPAAAAILVLFGLVVLHPFPPAVDPGVLELSAIDVGQGDSLFVAFPDGHLMLVDGGGFTPNRGHPHHSKLDTGEDVVSPWLWSRSIRRLDLIVCTHAHEDHITGLHAVIDNFHPRELWTGASPPTPIQEALLAHARRAGMKIEWPRAGYRTHFGEASVEVLAPVNDYEPGDAPENNDSLVMRIAYRHRSFLLTGDMEAPVEQRLLAEGVLLTADVLKVGHHGSRTSSTEPFLDAVRPQFAIISDGIDNQFHHPHPQVLARLADRRADTLRTDKLGLITVRTGGWRITEQDWEHDLRPRLLAAPAPMWRTPQRAGASFSSRWPDRGLKPTAAR